MQKCLIFVDLVEFSMSGFTPCSILGDIERSYYNIAGSRAAELVNSVNCDVVDVELGAVFEGVVSILVGFLIKVDDELIPSLLKCWVFNFRTIGDFPDPQAFEAGWEIRFSTVALDFMSSDGAEEVPVV